jgi:serine/threonine protein kinase
MNQIGNFIIKEEFDSGSSSSVHFACNIITNEECCVKIMEKSKTNVHLLQNEIQILKSVNHPNIVSYIDNIETETHFYIFQELCKGKTLFDVIVEEKKLKEKIAQKVFHQVIEAIDSLQRLGISHLDVKAENIICSSEYQIKLIDFGFATSNIGLLDSVCGSLEYIAPEILNFTPYYGMIADMWSCGVLLFALLTGKLPFDEETDLYLVKAIKGGNYSIPKSISESPSNLIKLLLEKSTEKRISPREALEHKWFENIFEENDSNNIVDKDNK